MIRLCIVHARAFLHVINQYKNTEKTHQCSSNCGTTSGGSGRGPGETLDEHIYIYVNNIIHSHFHVIIFTTSSFSSLETPLDVEGELQNEVIDR